MNIKSLAVPAAAPGGAVLSETKTPAPAEVNPDTAGLFAEHMDAAMTLTSPEGQSTSNPETAANARETSEDTAETDNSTLALLIPVLNAPQTQTPSNDSAAARDVQSAQTEAIFQTDATPNTSAARPASESARDLLTEADHVNPDRVAAAQQPSLISFPAAPAAPSTSANSAGAVPKAGAKTAVIEPNTLPPADANSSDALRAVPTVGAINSISSTPLTPPMTEIVHGKGSQAGTSVIQSAPLSPNASSPALTSSDAAIAVDEAPQSMSETRLPALTVESVKTGSGETPKASANPSLPASSAPGNVAEQKVPIVPALAPATAEITAPAPETAGNVKNAAVPATDRPPQTGGIYGAKYALPMQKADKVKEFTGSPEQNLPVTATSRPEDSAVPTALRPATLPASAEKSEHPAAVNSSSPAVTSTTETATDSGSTAPALPLRSVERTQDLMALHGMRLRDSGHDSMQVVIKPDANLHLALNLQIRNGAIEVSAELQRGDFELLNRHWTDLQQQLEARGIRLAPLNQPESSGAQNGGGFSRHSDRQHNEEKTAKNGAFAEFALSSVLVPKRTNKTTSPRGWESWA